MTEPVKATEARQAADAHQAELRAIDEERAVERADLEVALASLREAHQLELEELSSRLQATKREQRRASRQQEREREAAAAAAAEREEELRATSSTVVSLLGEVAELREEAEGATTETARLQVASDAERDAHAGGLCPDSGLPPGPRHGPGSAAQHGALHGRRAQCPSCGREAGTFFQCFNFGTEYSIKRTE